MTLDLGIYKSAEELHFSWFLNDLIEHGYVSKYLYESRTFRLLDDVKMNLDVINKKNKVKSAEVHLLYGTDYTPDFEIHFTEKALGVICNGKPCKKKPYFLGVIEDEITNEYVCFIDVKGGAKNGQNNKNFSQFSFPLKQKLTYHVLGIYVQKVVPEKLFQKTFIPSRLFYTDKTNQLRKLDKYKNQKGIKEYVNEIIL